MSCAAALALTDCLSLLLASHLSGLLIPPWSRDSAGVAVIAALIGFIAWRHYNRRKPFLRELREVFLVLALACLMQVTVLTHNGNRGSVQAAIHMWLFAALVTPLGRIAVKLMLTRLRLWQRRVVLIGSGRIAFDTMTALSSEPLMGLHVHGFVQAGESVLPDSAQVLELTPAEAWRLVDAVVLVALEEEHAALRASWLRALGAYRAANVMLVADLPGVPLHGMVTTYMKKHDLLLMQVRDNLSRSHVRFFKRFLDLIGATLISLLLSPLLLFIAWQVRKDGGKAIYGHMRIGSNAKPFHCYKFRSMVVDSEATLSALLEADPDARVEWERDFKLRDDPRITRIGKFLRRTSLDELPQLLNVIRGEMSLVGPRPIVEQELTRYGDEACYYLMARPGMTGLWQVSGRNDADYTTRVHLDAWYVRNWSLWYDIAILFKTARVVFRRDGAY